MCLQRTLVLFVVVFCVLSLGFSIDVSVCACCSFAFFDLVGGFFVLESYTPVLDNIHPELYARRHGNRADNIVI